MIYAVILAGGVGSRFWPFSRELEPKQLMKIIGEKSLLQATVERVRGMITPSNIYVITNSIHFYEVKAQLSRLDIPDDNIILEPMGKNTAPAIGLAAKLIAQTDPEAVLVVLPADHHIKDLPQFRHTLKHAIQAANEGKLATIGIKPVAPATGYGYIKVKGQSSKVKGGGQRQKVYAVERFLEKPNLNNAKKYVKDKKFYWNSGMFVWKAKVFLEELKRYLPGLHRSLNSIHVAKDIERVWPKIKAISVDYGIMERSKKIALVPAKFYWTDLGSWDSLEEFFPKDKSGNILSPDTLALNCRGVGVFSRGNRLICAVGAKDLVVADTPDALLICDRNKTQEVKNLVSMLKSANRKERLVHLTERRPWGKFTILQSGMGFKIKLIEIDPGKRLSLQRHTKRAEHWVVVSGTAKVIAGSKSVLVRSNESIYIPKGTKHRLANTTAAPLKIVEVQTGEYLGEDDIERFSDDFKKGTRLDV
jgi:mannose-1-phosphate guanylyltransferase/mannose-6-phosphate isomerase